MYRALGALLVPILSGLLSAQTAAPSPPPQTAREALLEMVVGSSPDHLEKHLPEIARKAFARIDRTQGRNPLAEFQGMSAQIKSGGAIETHATGPILLAAQQGEQKIELVIERDDLMGEDDQIELSFHMYRNGREESLPVLPRLTFTMKMEADIWRLQDLAFSAHMPLGDPDFIASLAKQVEKQQRATNEMMGMTFVRSIVTAETAYASNYPSRGFTCSLADLGGSGNGQPGIHHAMLIDDELASGKKNGYIFALTGCDSPPANHFKVAAEPAAQASGMRAYCADESGVVKSAADGKATTCLASGTPLHPGSAQ
jgi:hypothetical protein